MKCDNASFLAEFFQSYVIHTAVFRAYIHDADVTTGSKNDDGLGAQQVDKTHSC